MLYSYDLIVLLRVFTLFYEYHFLLNVQPLCYLSICIMFPLLQTAYVRVP